MEENNPEPERVKLYHFYKWYTEGSAEADEENEENEDEDDGELLERSPGPTVGTDVKQSHEVDAGSIRIQGMDGLDYDIVRKLKGMTKGTMKFQVENHAMR